MRKITPIILCGGTGTRLWPLSRASEPKQFHPVNGNSQQTFLQATVKRHVADGFTPPVLIGSAAHAERILDQLGDLARGATLISEPIARNTGPAVLAAAYFLRARDPRQLMLVVPSDHIVDGDLNGAIQAMIPAAEAGRIVSFGIRPEYPETGFGYIVPGADNTLAPRLSDVDCFVEKPPHNDAKKLIDNGALWASGLSLFRADTLISEYDRLDGKSASAVWRALIEGHQGPFGLVLNTSAFSEATSGPTESIVFENSPLVSVSALDIKWSDVGSWAALYDLGCRDENLNVIEGSAVHSVATRNCYVRSGHRIVSTVGVENLVIVDTEDALLVADLQQTQHVKKIVEGLKKAGHPEVMLRTTKKSSERGILDHKLEPAARLLVADHETAVDLIVLEGCLRLAGTDQMVVRGFTQRLSVNETLTLINTGPTKARLLLAPASEEIPANQEISA